MNKTEIQNMILTPKEVADILKISRNKAYELFRRESFPAFRIGKQYRIRQDRFLTWLDSDDAKDVA